MKTIEELFNEINASEELQEEFKAIKDDDAVAAFLKKYDCGATVDEFGDYLIAQKFGKEGELSDDEASAASGGMWIITDAGWLEIDETLPPKKKRRTQTVSEPTYQPGGFITIEEE